MVKSNYEQQSYLIRCCRWWRYMPLAIVWGVIKIVGWVLTGMQKNADATYKWEAKSIWLWSIDGAKYDMGACEPLKGVLIALRRTRGKQ